MNNEKQSEKLEVFIKSNKQFLNDPLINEFLSIPENYKMLVSYICTPNLTTKEEIDNTFKEFYFQIRFTSYISKTIHFHGINFDKKVRQLAHRYPLQDDLQANNNSNLLSKNLFNSTGEDCINSKGISDYISDSELYQAIQKLSILQKDILYLSYVLGLKDTEIATYQGKSQQAVFKSRKSALKKIKSYLDRSNNDSNKE